MTIKDSRNRHISVTAKYTAEHRTFISTLKTNGGKMLRDKHKNYVILAQGDIKNGSLTLFPIEIYDFIDPPDNSNATISRKSYPDYSMSEDI